MFRRLIKLPNNNSFFLFGARGTGKSTLLSERFDTSSQNHVDLLNTKTESSLNRDPELLRSIVAQVSPNTTHFIIDEIQKVPRLLDVVHSLIEDKSTSLHFVLTGSSAKKLKAGGANLLAGRAFVRNLFPLTADEIDDLFILDDALKWGTLPKIYSCSSNEDKRDFLEAYALTYLREEIWNEQIIRKLEPFRRFLEVAAQCNGKTLNYSKIARDVGVDSKTVQSYYDILVDTLLGFYVDTYHTSVRKRISKAPKFYLTDTGMARALAGWLGVHPQPSTSYYGDLFEQWLVSEIYRLNDYKKRDFKFSYLNSFHGAEIDLVIDIPAQQPILLEITSADHVSEEFVENLKCFEKDFPQSRLLCLSRDPIAKRFGRIEALHWKRGLEVIFNN